MIKIDYKPDNFNHHIKILLFRINHLQISITLIDNINHQIRLDPLKIIKITKIIDKM